jgi:hypothetical protein
MHGLAGYTISFSVSARKDIRDHFYQCITDTMDLYNKTIDILLSEFTNDLLIFPLKKRANPLQK